jgi:cysteine desulfurase
MRRIYLDNAATTAVAPEVRQVMDGVYDKYFGNPSSIHSFGQEAKKIVDEGRMVVSRFVGCEPEEIIFTSGGSESDNLAIRGIVDNWRAAGKEGKPHIIASALEHHAVLHTVQDLEKAGRAEATFIKPNSEGLITPRAVKEAIKDNTVLVSIIYVNNETGVVTPIREIGLMLEKENEGRAKSNRIFYHTDAVQAAEFFNISPEYLKVDLLTFTAHKIHGPKGIGVLYVRKTTPIKSQIIGGEQEFRKRAGTENVAGIAGLAKALDLILMERADNSDFKALKSLPESVPSKESNRLSNLRDKLIQGIADKIPSAILNGSVTRRSPNIVNISFLNAEGEAIILNLDFLGIAVSSGSACTSRSLDPSHVLSSMGIPPEKAHGSIRFSLSRYTLEEDVNQVLGVLPAIIEKLRAMSPFKS